ncbi:uncharacterized protein LOC120271606 [Dioscorea cayenensis subsp. rotundata]|uniref:Uncharacterized protein LOC120271606 n=1 Tax=Dioscorea cayennensis subsp. rotundata TaxID=55577 RepID=A0AB40C367_DIOCR|nr:uncharacterized protein LOC120271606 [Dioscorea cayenensis subsp. rotundata]
MDKSWINLSTRANDEYINGVVSFLDFAFAHSAKDGKFFCPCTKCVNTYHVSRSEAFDHIICEGFLKGYVQWIFHGESSGAYTSTSKSNEEEEDLHHGMHTLLNDAFGMDVDMEERTDELDDVNRRSFGDNQFYSLIKEAEESLYSTCTTFTKLSFMHWDWVTKKVHACPNDCMLFWKNKEHEDICSKCGASRWKEHANIVEDDSSISTKKKKPVKILRWFPLKPRLQRLFMSSKTATFMKWHEEGRTKDGNLRHPADSKCWKNLDARYPDFSSNTRNIRLGLASDGFNPFKTMNVTHSTWPIILIPYNLPPWMCMKQPNFILSLLIPGPKDPGNNIDVYMEPLIEELKELWEDGIETFDVSMNETFRMRAAILWTINDFPAYANLSGWSTKWAYACPICGYDTASRWFLLVLKFFVRNRAHLEGSIAEGYLAQEFLTFCSWYLIGVATKFN